MATQQQKSHNVPEVITDMDQVSIKQVGPLLVFNSHLVDPAGETICRVIQELSDMLGKHKMIGIVFREWLPQDESGEDVLGAYSKYANIATVHVPPHYTRAYLQVQGEQWESSLRCIAWIELLNTLAHEMKHGDMYNNADHMMPDADADEICADWAYQAIIDMARRGVDIAAPCGGMMDKMLIADIENMKSTNDAWAVNQLEIIDQGLCFLGEDGTKVHNIREWIKLGLTEEERAKGEWAIDEVKKAVAEKPTVKPDTSAEDASEAAAGVNTAPEGVADVQYEIVDDGDLDEPTGNVLDSNLEGLDSSAKDTVLAHPGLVSAEGEFAPMVDDTPAAMPGLEGVMGMLAGMLQQGGATAPVDTATTSSGPLMGGVMPSAEAPKHNLPANEVVHIVKNVYKMMLLHIFTKCGWAPGNSANESGFNAAGEVAEGFNIQQMAQQLGITGLENANQVFVAMDCNVGGQWRSKVPCEGRIVGSTSKAPKSLPKFDVYINKGDGILHKYLIIAQNKNKGSQAAQRAQQGARILMLYRAGENRPFYKVEAGNGPINSLEDISCEKMFA